MVYDNLFKNKKDLISKIEDFCRIEQPTAQQIKEISEDTQITFAEEKQRCPIEECKFHIVDKEQYGGGREIFVLDRVTKLH